MTRESLMDKMAEKKESICVSNAPLLLDSVFLCSADLALFTTEEEQGADAHFWRSRLNF